MRPTPIFIYLILLGIFILFFSDCRYKDNRGVHLQPTKRRLGRVWQLREAFLIDSGINLIARKPALAEATLSIGHYEEGANVTLNNTYFRFSVLCALTENKTRITPYEPTTGEHFNYSLKIEKLTNKELWLRGNPILRLVDSVTDSSTVYLRYEAIAKSWE